MATQAAVLALEEMIKAEPGLQAKPQGEPEEELVCFEEVVAGAVEVARVLSLAELASVGRPMRRKNHKIFRPAQGATDKRCM